MRGTGQGDGRGGGKLIRELIRKLMRELMREAHILLLRGRFGREDARQEGVGRAAESRLEVGVEGVVVLVHEPAGHVADVAGEVADDESFLLLELLEARRAWHQEEVVLLVVAVNLDAEG